VEGADGRRRAPRPVPGLLRRGAGRTLQLPVPAPPAFPRPRVSVAPLAGTHCPGNSIIPGWRLGLRGLRRPPRDRPRRPAWDPAGRVPHPSATWPTRSPPGGDWLATLGATPHASGVPFSVPHGGTPSNPGAAAPPQSPLGRRFSSPRLVAGLPAVALAKAGVPTGIRTNSNLTTEKLRYSRFELFVSELEQAIRCGVMQEKQGGNGAAGKSVAIFLPCSNLSAPSSHFTAGAVRRMSAFLA